MMLMLITTVIKLLRLVSNNDVVNGMPHTHSNEEEQKALLLSGNRTQMFCANWHKRHGNRTRDIAELITSVCHLDHR